jgi:hypothetical protein
VNIEKAKTIYLQTDQQRIQDRGETIIHETAVEERNSKDHNGLHSPEMNTTLELERDTIASKGKLEKQDRHRETQNENLLAYDGKSSEIPPQQVFSNETTSAESTWARNNS